MKWQLKIIAIIAIAIITSLSACNINNPNIESTDKENQMEYETKEQAEEYAINLFKEKYPDINLDNFNILTNDESICWVVYTHPQKTIYGSVKGGGGPFVKFKKSDGNILEIGLQK